MLRAFKTILSQSVHHARCRRQRRCIPSFTDSSSCLEDRVLLSAAGGMAHTAEIARNPADTKVGREVTNLFESILHTNPTSAQLTRSIHELRSGMSVVALRKDLTAEARAQQGARAQPSMVAVVANGASSALAMTSTSSAAIGAISPVPLIPGLSAPIDADIPLTKLSQIPAGMSVSLSFAPAASSTMTFSFGSPAATSMSGTTSPTTGMTGMSSTTGMTGMSSTTGMTGMSSTTGMSMSSIGSMSSIAFADLGASTTGSMSSTQATFADMGASTTMMATGM
jgi:hypothetical protein